MKTLLLCAQRKGRVRKPVRPIDRWIERERGRDRDRDRTERQTDRGRHRETEREKVNFGTMV